MGNITGSIRLTALKNSFLEQRKTKEGQKITCLVIPLDPNYLSVSEGRNGTKNVFMNWSAFPRKSQSKIENDKSTHIINQDPGKETRGKLKQLNEYPTTLGNLVDWDNTTSQHEEPEGAADYTENTDDLPF